MQNNRLGKGLDSLLPRAANSESTILSNDQLQKVLNIDIEKIKANPDQPRKDFDDQALEDLANSIKEKGVIQPILVQEAGFNEYIIIAGERRYRASLRAGKKHIPAIVKKYDDEETLEIALIENLQREDLNPLEEALAFQRLISNYSLTQESIAIRLGKSRSAIANSLRLLKLPDGVLDSLRKNLISAGHARAILAINRDDKTAEEFSTLILEKGLSVREAETLSKSIAGGATISDAYEAVQQVSLEERSGTELAHVLDISKGARIQSTGQTQSVTNDTKESASKPAELWGMEEELIVSMGTKVQIKGDLKTGKIEINYYSMDDLNRVFELLTKGKV